MAEIAPNWSTENNLRYSVLKSEKRLMETVQWTLDVSLFRVSVIPVEFDS